MPQVSKAEKRMLDQLKDYFKFHDERERSDPFNIRYDPETYKPKRKRKLSSWQKFIKANSNKKKFKYANGKLKLKTMGIAYRKTAAYKRNKKK